MTNAPVFDRAYAHLLCASEILIFCVPAWLVCYTRLLCLVLVCDFHLCKVTLPRDLQRDRDRTLEELKLKRYIDVTAKHVSKTYVMFREMLF